MVLTACTASAQPAFGGRNGTPLHLTLSVNGVPVGTLDPGQDVKLGSSLPRLPWTVEARSPSGRLIGTLEVPVDHLNRLVRFDLSCGGIMLWAGTEPPSYGPAPPSPAGAPGDCDP